MAGVITHMVIAREIEKRLSEGTMKDRGLFFLGNLAPDAIHARADYERMHKKHTHFRDGIMDKEFELESNMLLFHDRLAAFIYENREREDGLLDLYRGYAVHILTDELFVLTIRKEFCAVMEKLGISQNDSKFFEYIVADMNRNDLLLVQNYEDIDIIRSEMEQVQIHSINGYLTEKEMSISRDWLVRRHFVEQNEIVEPVYISYERILDFIQMAADNVVKQLTEDILYPRMF